MSQQKSGDHSHYLKAKHNARTPNNPPIELGKMEKLVKTQIMGIIHANKQNGVNVPLFLFSPRMEAKEHLPWELFLGILNTLSLILPAYTTLSS